MAKIKNTHGIPICQVCGGYPCVCEANTRRNAICKKPPEPSPLDALLSLLKPLEWVESDPVFKLSDRHYAFTVFGKYAVNPSGDGFVWQIGSMRGKCNSIDHGKELCQADYRQRVAKLFREMGE